MAKQRKGNTSITKKEQALKAQIARSKAARKGWKTRRKNKLVEKVKYTKKQADYFDKKLDKKKKAAKLPATPKLRKQTNKQLIAELRAENARLKALPQDLVPDAYWTRRDGRMAAHPSMVRAMLEEMPEGAREELEDDFDDWVENGLPDEQLRDLVSYWSDWFFDEYPDLDIPMEDFFAFFKS